MNTQPRKPKNPSAVVTFVLALMVVAAFVVGHASGSTETVSASPQVITKTETVTVDVVPQACLDALTAADNGYLNALDAAQAALNVVSALADEDYETAVALSSEMPDALNEEMATVYADARDECRAAS